MIFGVSHSISMVREMRWTFSVRRHHGEDSAEALAVPGNAFSGFAERQSLPCGVLGLLPEQVDDALLAGSTVGRHDLLAREHGVFFLAA